jgi:7-carboxy-7-deazaguanine synthase
LHSDKKIPLVEMFGPTIQGEGAVIGQQTYFMRFGLCDYKCTMCDSMNAVDPQQVRANAKWLTQEELVASFEGFRDPSSTRWLTLSGGNPAIHDLAFMVRSLKSHGIRIAVVTQGTKCPEWLGWCDVVTCSPKGPGMGENCDLTELDDFVAGVSRHGGLQALNMKVVVFDQRDLEFAKMVWERYEGLSLPFYLSLGNPYPPGYHEDQHPSYHLEHMDALIRSYKCLFEDIKNDPILSQMRFLPQWHVFVWGNEKGK